MLLKLEYSKETLRNTCIFVKSDAHAKKVIRFYESHGFQNKITQIPKIGWYIAAVDFTKQNGIPLADVICYTSFKKLNEIKLPVRLRRKFPRVMMVSNDKETWLKRTVFAKLNNKYRPYIICSPSGSNYKGFQYAKEID